MRWALASTLTVEIHSAASGFRLGISTSARAYRVDRRPAFGVRMLRVVSGLVGWKGVQKHACRAIADSRSWWKYVGSRVGLSAGRTRRIPHAAQSRAGAQRGNALGREWVICRKGTLEHACCAIASLHSAWKRTGSRAGLSAGRAHWYTHAGQSRARTLRGDALGRERVYRPDMYAATRIRHNRGLALTVEIHRASSVCNSGYPRPIRPCRPATRAPSPLKTTALRVVRDAGYPHACAFADAMTDARSERRDRPAILAGQGSPADRVLTLTVEMHSVASRFGDRISTRGLALAPLARSRPNRTCTPRRTEPPAERSRLAAPTNDRVFALAAALRSASSRLRTPRGAAKSARCRPRTRTRR